MKTFAQAAIIFMIVIITVFVGLNIVTGSITDNEVENTLAQSVEQALFLTMSEEKYSIDSRDDFIVEFNRQLILQTQSDADLTIRILSVNEVDGAMDVEVTETLTYPDGKVREVQCRKTVIFEEETE